ncbi:MAG: hypothetical protein KG003_04945 [Bacteroidetes bacterium]|nr:hypothetical protein [Bacteroidota bacterium]
MLKNEIEDISLSCVRNGKVLFYLKVSKTGTMTRIGFGRETASEVKLEMKDKAQGLYNEVCAQIPEEFSRLILTPQKIAENETEYAMVLGGGAFKKNENGEMVRELVNGIRISHQQFNGYKHPLMPAVEQIFKHAERISNPYYFDAVINHAFQTKSNVMNGSAIISGPIAFSERQHIIQDFSAYLKETGQFNSIVKGAADRIYTDENGKKYKLEKQMKNLQTNLFLAPVTGSEHTQENQHKSDIRYEKRKPSGNAIADKVVGFFSSISVVMFILMLAIIIYLTFYL